MSEILPNTTADLFERIELLRKWQEEQQQRLLLQQSEQTEFLTNEHKRMYEALDLDDTNTSTDQITNVNVVQNLDETPSISQTDDYYRFSEEHIQMDLNTRDITLVNKPKRPFLKKGTGLCRFRMTLDDLAHKKTKPQRLSLVQDKTVNGNGNKSCRKPEIKTNSEVVAGNDCKSMIVTKCTDVETFFTKDTQSCPRATWSTLNNANKTAKSTLNRQELETIPNSPDAEKLTAGDLLDELKIFELLEQKASNSSFCSTSSLVTRLMEHSIKSTPKRALPFSSKIDDDDYDATATTEEIKSPKRTVTFASKQETVPEENEEELDSSDTDESTTTESTVNSDDVSDNLSDKTPTNPTSPVYHNKWNSDMNSNPISNSFNKPLVTTTDAAINTDEPLICTDLLKTRYAELETEIETFRYENDKIKQLKHGLEADRRNFEKRKKKLERELEEQKVAAALQLEQDRGKLAKDRLVYDRYARELREGKIARKKERDEINALKSKMSAMEEEYKLKETRSAATQARLRNQLKQLEKENINLRTDCTELRTKNAKLEANQKHLTSRRPNDTKVLHEINRNLTKLAQDSKVNVTPPTPVARLKTEETNKREERNKRSQSSRKSSISDDCCVVDKENDQNSINSTNSTTRSMTDCSFESIEREYEKKFGQTAADMATTTNRIPTAELSSCSDTTTTATNKKEEIVLEDGSVRTLYPNGNVKTVTANGQLTIVRYHNGDIKETNCDSGTIRYLYSEAETWHTTFPDGLELLEFSNGQTEKRYPNGASEIYFPNGCIRCTSPGGTEEVTFPDGTVILTQPTDGTKILTLPNGQKEIHTHEHKRREYPDGTVKILYPDGVQETRYANGRIRLKDKHGNLIMDSAAN